MSPPWILHKEYSFNMVYNMVERNCVAMCSMDRCYCSNYIVDLGVSTDLVGHVSFFCNDTIVNFWQQCVLYKTTRFFKQNDKNQIKQINIKVLQDSELFLPKVSATVYFIR